MVYNKGINVLLYCGYINNVLFWKGFGLSTWYSTMSIQKQQSIENNKLFRNYCIILFRDLIKILFLNPD